MTRPQAERIAWTAGGVGLIGVAVGLLVAAGDGRGRAAAARASLGN